MDVAGEHSIWLWLFVHLLTTKERTRTLVFGALYYNHHMLCCLSSVVLKSNSISLSIYIYILVYALSLSLGSSVGPHHIVRLWDPSQHMEVLMTLEGNKAARKSLIQGKQKVPQWYPHDPAVHNEMHFAVEQICGYMSITSRCTSQRFDTSRTWRNRPQDARDF